MTSREDIATVAYVAGVSGRVDATMADDTMIACAEAVAEYAEYVRSLLLEKDADGENKDVVFP